MHTTAKSNSTGRSNFSPLSLGIVPFSQDIFQAHNKVLCSSLAGYITKAQQGQGKHNSELETYQRQGTSLERVSTPPATFGKYPLSIHFPKLQEGAHGCILFLQLLCQSSVGCLSTGVFALSCWDLQFTPSLFPCLTNPLLSVYLGLASFPDVSRKCPRLRARNSFTAYKLPLWFVPYNDLVN